MTPAIELPASGPAAWLGPEMHRRTDWIRPFDAAEIAEIEAAMRHARAAGRGLRNLRLEDFPLPTLAAATDAWLDELDTGRGFLLLRGLPVERWGDDDAALAYYGLGLHLGTAISQNADGDVLGHVRDAGLEKRDPTVRRYRTREPLGFHSDGADVIGLLCLRTARSGGTSRIVSSLAVLRELERRRPDLVSPLFEPLPFDRNGEERPGDPPYFLLPPCRVAEGRLRTFYIGWYIRDSQRHASAPRLTPAQREAMDLLEEIAEDPAFHLDMEFRPGDVQLLKNSVILHARTEYEDFSEPERKRHLLRLWLNARRPFADGDPLLQDGVPRRETESA